ncbi:unnamed protein product [Adineta steineri]|uniref:G-protein coupled receptors family 1 profile domain-containing protein n=1 Tax=Adineta steineri TaxID=433720 RepID=A0A819QDW3_9BILA|nr:unnamed protein product [Adineta steineri]CAF4029178.1 unnamed protein product [Adineta steineri]
MSNTTSSPSNQYDLVQAAKQPIIYSYSVTMTFIVITSILNVSVLCRRALRSSSCTYYFLASVPPVLAYVVVSPVNAILAQSYGFYINGTPVACKIVSFLSYATSLWYGLMLVCASIDRYFSSSTSVRLRRLSQVRVARRLIIIVWILSSIYMSPFLFIYYYDPKYANSKKCTQYSSTLIAVYLMTRVIFYYFLIPIILGIFGVLTIYNIRSQKHRVAPMNQASSSRRTEGQLARMLIIQVAMYLLFFTPSGITYILVTFVPSMNTSYYSTIRNLTIVWQQGGYFISFFLYVLTGRIYREELKNMFKCNRIPNRILQQTVEHIPMSLLANVRVTTRV